MYLTLYIQVWLAVPTGTLHSHYLQCFDTLQPGYPKPKLWHFETGIMHIQPEPRFKRGKVSYTRAISSQLICDSPSSISTGPILRGDSGGLPVIRLGPFKSVFIFMM
ncbi:hypothetical protein BKA67DRAFT_134670 [Truncatella angustata]|uniref:Uncharacterized protein n=1 Tax=Truncatella angustata TaxID=152316 RepID=A0A9P8RFC0_9PEZI|nr:uncharacterized protein BKA67DRAFT_134670 [Truncatella angustata]KAH6643416.1 hypothetical protein BKA67DRAFT_134670 [Truncatella angustata]